MSGLMVAGTITVCGGVVLALQAKGMRARKILSICMLTFGMMCFGRSLIPQDTLGVSPGFASSRMIFGGALFAMLVILYPIEVIRPGWINAKRHLLISSPFVVLAAIYFADILLLDSEDHILTSLEDGVAHMHYLNVWIRIPIVLVTIGYVVTLVVLLERNAKRYNKRIADNFSNLTPYAIKWLRFVGFSMLIIVATWVFWIVYGGIVGGVIYILLVIPILCLMIYKGLFQRDSYMQQNFKKGWNAVSEESGAAEEFVPSVATQFEQQMKRYSEQVERWMAEAKPFLRQDFSLVDVAEVVPVNRSYLSRLFNEYLGHSFSQYVQKKRVEYAKQILVERPEELIGNLASECGFYSASTMHRTFVQIVGTTPAKYRIDKLVELNDYKNRTDES